MSLSTAIADFILKLFNEDAGAYTQTIDKWVHVWVLLTFYGLPLLLLIILISPFLYMVRKRKRFSVRNVIIAAIVGILLAAGIGAAIITAIVFSWGYGIRQLYEGQSGIF